MTLCHSGALHVNSHQLTQLEEEKHQENMRLGKPSRRLPKAELTGVGCLTLEKSLFPETL